MLEQNTHSKHISWAREHRPTHQTIEQKTEAEASTNTSLLQLKMEFRFATKFTAHFIKHAAHIRCVHVLNLLHFWRSSRSSPFLRVFGFRFYVIVGVCVWLAHVRNEQHNIFQEKSNFRIIHFNNFFIQMSRLPYASAA